MKIDHVEVMGFRSFRHLVRIEFPTGPGLVHLRGKNLDNTRLGGNASGKTSLWEAICWCLFGRTAAGLKGPEVATWSGGQGVYVLVAVNGHKVLRTWGATNKLQLDGHDAAQEQVDAVIGLSYESYLHAHYHAQHEPSFLDLMPTAKVELLSSVLDLDKWTARSKKAAARADEEQLTLDAIEKRLRTTEGALGELEHDFEKEADDWERNRRARRRHFAQALEELETRLASIPRVSENALQRLIEEERLQLIETQKLRDCLRRDEKLLAECNADIKRNEATSKMDECPTCGQKVRADHRDDCRRKVRRDQEAADRLHRDCEVWEERLARESKALDATARAITANQSDARSHKERRAAMLDMIDRAKEDLEQITNEVNPFDKEIKRVKERKAALLAKRDKLEGEATYFRAYIERINAWVQRFKDIRLFLITEALAQLEVETNAALVNLGLTGWSITFSPDSETKSGAVKRGFTTMIQSPDNPRPVPWSVWSGGEAQRLRLAADMGVADLIASYTGAPAFVEAWDEPSSGINAEGIDDMVKAFKERAMSRGKQVWLIDHRALASGDFDLTFTAVKQNGATEVKQD